MTETKTSSEMVVKTRPSFQDSIKELPITNEILILKLLAHFRDQFDLEQNTTESPERPLSHLFEKEPEYHYSYLPMHIWKIQESSKTRTKIIQEILQTERSYVSELDVAFSLYFTGISAQKMLPRTAFLIMFSNFSLIRKLHKTYLFLKPENFFLI
jgi:hypothetical protein